MDDQVLVRVLRRPRRPSGTAASRCGNVERALASQYRSIGSPVDVLHDEVRQAVVGGAAVEQARDVADARAGPGSAARAGTAAAGSSVSMPRLTSLIATCLRYVVVTHAAIHRAHAALPDESGQAICADALPDPGVRGVLRDGVSRALNRGCEKGVGDLLRQERVDLSTQC